MARTHCREISAFSGGVAMRYLPQLMDDVMFAHNGPYEGMSTPLQRVTSLRRRAPLLHRIGCVVS